MECPVCGYHNGEWSHCPRCGTDLDALLSENSPTLEIHSPSK